MTDLPKILHSVIEPGLALLPERMITPEARCMLLAIGLQESGFAATVQMGGGPAMGFWQFERGGGVAGVLSHPASAKLAADVCKARSVKPVKDDLYHALAVDQVLASAIARLLLYTDASALPLPTAASADASWAYYLRNWRPGKPHAAAWPAHWQVALNTLGLA